MRRRHQRHGFEESAVADEAGKARAAGDTHARHPRRSRQGSGPSRPRRLVLFTVGLCLVLLIAFLISFLPSGPSCRPSPSRQPPVQGLRAARDRAAWASGRWTPHSAWGGPGEQANPSFPCCRRGEGCGARRPGGGRGGREAGRGGLSGSSRATDPDVDKERSTRPRRRASRRREQPARAPRDGNEAVDVQKQGGGKGRVTVAGTGGRGRGRKGGLGAARSSRRCPPG